MLLKKCLILLVASLGFSLAADTAAFAVERMVANIPGSAPSSNGWLLVQFGTSFQSLPAFTKVDLLSTLNGRHTFKVLEGPHRGKTGSVSTVWNGRSTLVTAQGHKSTVTVTYYKSQKLLKIQSGTAYITMKATIDPANPLTNGSYPLRLPDAPHDVPSYLDPVTYSRTWFPIVTSSTDRLVGQRFLHVGSVSAGCTTVTGDNTNASRDYEWRRAYAYLITSRTGDGSTIGTLNIVN